MSAGFFSSNTIRMRRPPGTREALGRSPLMKTNGAHSSRIERVPLMSAATRPAVVLAGRPAAERAPDARAGRTLTLLCVEFAICHNGRVQNAGYYDLRFVM